MTSKTSSCVTGAVLALVVAGYGGLSLWTGSSHVDDSSYRSFEFEYDDASDRDFDAQSVSTDLGADLRLMWETGPMRSGEGEASSIASVMAASRVFNTVSLVGKTGAEAKALLGSPINSSRSVYRGQPFWPLRARGMIYRFDCGMFGWQFNVYCEGDDAPVTEVERRWIH